MARIVNIPLPGVGHDEFTIYPDMFLVDGVSPEDVRLYSAGVFQNCTRVSDTILHLDNPTTEPATFTFEIEYRMAIEDPGWTYEVSWYQVGIRYKSLGSTNINTTLVRNAISEDNNKVGELGQSALINPYSKHKSDKVAPHALGEWRLYTHTMPGGTALDYQLWVEATVGGAFTYSAKTTPVPYRYDYKLLGVLASRWVALAGLPYTYTRITVHDQDGDPVALGTGGRGVVLWSGTLTNNTGAGGTATYYVKSYHCATIGGTYVEGDSITVTVNLGAKPYTLTVDAGFPTRVLDTATIQVDYTGNGHLLRFSVMPHATWEPVDHQTYGDEADIEMSIVHVDNIASGSAWRLQIEYPAGSGIWETEASGNLP
jgi:hypothetical protein